MAHALTVQGTIGPVVAHSHAIEARRRTVPAQLSGEEAQTATERAHRQPGTAERDALRAGRVRVRKPAGKGAGQMR